jgi:hypothetical protein
MEVPPLPITAQAQPPNQSLNAQTAPAEATSSTSSSSSNNIIEGSNSNKKKNATTSQNNDSSVKRGANEEAAVSDNTPSLAAKKSTAGSTPSSTSAPLIDSTSTSSSVPAYAPIELTGEARQVFDAASGIISRVDDIDDCILYLHLPMERVRQLAGDRGTASVSVMRWGARSGARIHFPRSSDSDLTVTLEGSFEEEEVGIGIAGKR